MNTWPQPPHGFELAALKNIFSIFETQPVPIIVQFLDELMASPPLTEPPLYLIYLGEYDGHREQTQSIDMISHLPPAVHEELMSHPVKQALIKGLRVACEIFVARTGLKAFQELVKNFNPE